jgi:hypothetical protein
LFVRDLYANLAIVEVGKFQAFSVSVTCVFSVLLTGSTPAASTYNSSIFSSLQTKSTGKAKDIAISKPLAFSEIASPTRKPEEPTSGKSVKYFVSNEILHTMGFEAKASTATQSIGQGARKPKRFLWAIPSRKPESLSGFFDIARTIGQRFEFIGATTAASGERAWNQPNEQEDQRPPRITLADGRLRRRL